MAMESFMGRRVTRHSPPRIGKKIASPSLSAAMEEVHTNIPSTVKRAKHFGPGGQEAMLRAIAYSKAGKK